MANLDTKLRRIKQEGSGDDGFSLTESHCLSFTHLSLTVSPPPHRQGKTQPVVLHSLDRGPLWPPSSNFRLHVGCAREPAPANSRSSWFYYFILKNRSQPVLRHCAMVEPDEPLHYFSVMNFPLSVAVCYPYVSFCVLFLIWYLSVNFTRCTGSPAELMMPKVPFVFLNLCK